MILEEIDKDFIGKIFNQNCKDSLKVLGRIINNSAYYICQFLKYPCFVQAGKKEIVNGNVLNPLIEQYEFLQKEWKQKCGDSLKVLKDSGKRQGTNILWECEFIKYPYKVFCKKDKILKGTVLNPRIEEEEFIKKEWKQSCGDTLKILSKDLKHKGYYFCEFIKYPYKIKCQKVHIIEGGVYNPNIPTYTSGGEKELRDYICSIYKGHIFFDDWSTLGDKEIDILIPNLELAFEFNGCYWHSIRCGKKNKYHQEKTIKAAKQNIRLIHIWEDEWMKDKEGIKNWIYNIINNIEDFKFFDKISENEVIGDFSKVNGQFFINKGFRLYKITSPSIILRNKEQVYNCGKIILRK